MTPHYNRSEILSYYDLTEDQKKEVNSLYDDETTQEDSYVVINAFNSAKSHALPLSQFMKTTNNKFTHGIYSLSFGCGYFITINSSGDQAVIAYKYF